MNATEDQAPTGDVTGMARLERQVEEWRGRIDELLVQVDLASKDVSDDVRSRVTAAENAYLAAKNKIQQVPKDAGSQLGSLRDGVEKLLDDLRQACQSVEAALRRGRSAE